MDRKEEVFIPALKNRKIPILTLDNNWHRLFTQTEPSERITALEQELNELLKKQGKVNTETKEIKKLKKRLMDEIVTLMSDMNGNPSKATEKKLKENRRLIEECNEKLAGYEDDMFEIPKAIDQKNYELMLETMEICYEEIGDNNTGIEEITKWVEGVRVELKKKLVEKQKMLDRNQSFYNYMHNIFGPDVIDMFDMKYNIVPIVNSKPQDKANPEKSKDSGDKKTQ